ncbi:response regulator [Sphingopyxis terrae]|uniref:Response regulator receiver domain-containing protein n=1 Tax=Sphingopyxis terrae subsp. ummariensis TaxID=429001 RepID=A0A1Y6FVC9_9SPHN|nr:response regulator [Sphingopyxis terrae]SMQ76503.1 Response regulator receiver domain-containing protein [Sphingopyxis terrae subsp. ummariensis]
MDSILRGKTIFVVEDEYFIAADLSRALVNAGAEVIGPLADLDAAMKRAREHSLDAAILDINLEGRMSYPLVDLLGEDNVPMLLLTGYDQGSLPAACRQAPCICKPHSIDHVLGELARLLARPEGASEPVPLPSRPAAV